MQEVLDYLHEFNIGSTVFRMILALLGGVAIGLGRNKKGRSAGMRTYALISIGAAASVLVTLYDYEMLRTIWSETFVELGEKYDALRIAGQTVTGIGFLGAGIIIKATHQQVKGLTTSTGLFVTVCMGIACGAGYYELVIMSTVITILVLNVMSPLEIAFKRRLRNITLNVEFDSVEDVGVASDVSVFFFGEGEESAGKDLSVWDYDLRSAHKDESAPATAEVNVLGKVFTGTYSYSAVYYPATHLSHQYATEYGSFSVNAETGALDAFTVGYEKTDETVTVEECRERATEAAKKFINIDEYTLDVTEADPDSNLTSHVFRWTKYVDDVPTCDVFSIGLSIYGGGIASIGCSLVGSFEATEENVRAVRRLKNADLEGILKAKVAERFDGVEYELWWDDFSAACLPDGTVTLKTKAEIARNEVDEADGETYFYPHTSAYDTYFFESEAK